MAREADSEAAESEEGEERRIPSFEGQAAFKGATSQEPPVEE